MATLQNVLQLVRVRDAGYRRNVYETLLLRFTARTITLEQIIFFGDIFCIEIFEFRWCSGCTVDIPGDRGPSPEIARFIRW